MATMVCNTELGLCWDDDQYDAFLAAKEVKIKRRCSNCDRLKKGTGFCYWTDKVRAVPREEGSECQGWMRNISLENRWNKEFLGKYAQKMERG